MADAVLDDAIPNIVNSCFGHSGQRCFAVSNVLIHHDIYDAFMERFIEACRKLKLGGGMDPGVDIGPVVNKAALDRLRGAVDRAVAAGAKILLDGRDVKVPEYPDGLFIGPTLMDADPNSEAFRDEIFGPVRCVKRVADINEAVAIVNASPFGHTAVIYTESGGPARKFIRECNTGQVGVNVGTPAPIAFYPVGGRRISFFGSHRGRANDAVDFYTDKKVVVTRWNRTDTPTAKNERSSVLF
jgi:malonate-semialdehyde dehydrogenase (acetylating)/methylmalonate-semialdehyde dehydrogenase